MLASSCFRSALRGLRTSHIASAPQLSQLRRPFATTSDPSPLTTKSSSASSASSSPSPSPSSSSSSTSQPASDLIELPEPQARMPRALQALYIKPLKRQPTHGLPVCDLQLRSFSVRNLEFFADFALRAAYYLNLPASGPVPLPRITQRWTVIRSNFAHKKSQENFERITLRRVIQIKDGHPDVVQTWLAFLRKYAYNGVGMKANVYEFCSMDVAKTMDEEAKQIEEEVQKQLELFGAKAGIPLKTDTENSEPVGEFIDKERLGFNTAWLSKPRK